MERMITDGRMKDKDEGRWRRKKPEGGLRKIKKGKQRRTRWNEEK